jgi:tetratricopeptide (TPR) repeat protein
MHILLCVLMFADLEPGHVINLAAPKPQREAAQLASDAGKALTTGDFAGAISLAEKAIATHAGDPWAHYVRGVALARQGKVDEAIGELRLAEQNVAPDERWGRSIMTWARANAYYQVGRCDDAKAAFNDYLLFVKKEDPRAAAAAQEHIDGCRPAWVAPVPPVAPRP